MNLRHVIKIYKRAKSVTAILPVATLIAYTLAFIVFYMYFFSNGMSLNNFMSLDIKDYIALLSSTTITSLIIVVFLFSPSVTIYIQTKESFASVTRSNIFKMLMKNPVETFGYVVFGNGIFAVLLTVLFLFTSHLTKESMAWAPHLVVSHFFMLIFAVFFALKCVLDLVWARYPKIISFFLLAGACYLVFVNPGWLVYVSGYGNQSKYIVTSIPPSTIVENAFNFKSNYKKHGVCFATKYPVFIALVTKETVVASVGTPSNHKYDFYKFKRDDIYLEDNLQCQLCHYDINDQPKLRGELVNARKN